MTDIIIIAVVAIIIALAAGYIIKAKKSGRKCIGCPHSSSCGGACGGNKKEEKRYGQNNDEG